MLDALGAGGVDDAPIVQPSADELEEVDAAAKHLREVRATYWDSDWRRRHKGVDTSPGDQLWRAAQAAVEIADAYMNCGTEAGPARRCDATEPL